MTNFTLLDTISDPIIHTTKNGTEIASFMIQVKLDDISIKYYDFISGDEIAFEESVTKYGIEKTSCRFRCMINAIDYNIDLISLYIKSVNIWVTENVVQIKLTQCSNVDYSTFIPYMTMTRITRSPDLVLSY